MVRVRRMTREDILQVAALEMDAFPETTPPTDLGREMDNRLARYLVLEDDEAPAEQALIGYAAVWMVIDEAHLIAIGVRSDLRGKGLGGLLLLAALELAADEGAENMTLEVRVSNTVAQALYRKYGFQRVGVRRRYYPDNNEDALLMTAGGLDTKARREALAALRAAHRERRGPYELQLR